MNVRRAASTFALLAMLLTGLHASAAPPDQVDSLLAEYCYDCHDHELKKGDLDLSSLLEQQEFDGSLVFENLVTGKMPPDDKKQPEPEEKLRILTWLAHRQQDPTPKSFRRISRHEFVHSVNDLLGTNLDLSRSIPDDRGTADFDSDRKIILTKESLGAYFSVADELLDHAFPSGGFSSERIWKTNRIKDSHHTYNIYVRDYKEGLLFSWTRANNGNSYSFFYDNFEPPETAWYELTFDAAKLGEFREDISLLVYAGKYYFADDRPQPQRLLGVISLGNHDVQSHTINALLHPGENVSVHCYSQHTWRQNSGDQGAYIRELRVRGPIHESWPPEPYRRVFAGLHISAPKRLTADSRKAETALEAIGGSLSVSSFQEGMEKEKMQDGSNKTFWHTRFKPAVAKPPHFVIINNPAQKPVDGLSYSTWTGGNGNGQVKAYAIYTSEDGESWGDPILKGELETGLAAAQEINFPARLTSRHIKLLVTDAISLDGKSLASIGKLDVITPIEEAEGRVKIEVASSAAEDLKNVIRRFAENAFASTLTEVDLAPYYQVGLTSLEEEGNFVEATRTALKAIVCSHRFLIAPGEYQNRSFSVASDLARTLWLSVPDKRLLALAKADRLSADTLRAEIDRMLSHENADRMIRSFCAQWLNLRSFDKVAPSLKLYPLYNDLLNHYLPLETEAYLNHLIQENLPVSYLIDSDFSILNQRLAHHYGIGGVTGQHLRKVSFTPGTPRGGLLTMGSVLKITTDGHQTSPILRGAWISENIVGTPLSPPPANIQAIEPEHGEATTLRQQIEQHTTNKACYACHKSIDPYGFALESFDATGQWRTRYRVEKPHRGTFQYRQQGYYAEGGEVDASGQIGGSRFEDVLGLKAVLLSEHRKIAYNFAKKFFEYANGCKPNLVQRLDLYRMIPDNAEDCRMKDLITGVLVYSLQTEE